MGFATIPWHFTDKDAIAFSGQGRVRVLVDSDRVVGDFCTIATYLEDAYPDRPSRFRRQSRSRSRDVISALVLILHTVGVLSTRDLRAAPLECRRCRAIRGSEYGRYRSFRSGLI